MNSNLALPLSNHHEYPRLSFHLQTAVKKHIMKAALKRGVETGTLVMVKSSYKVSAAAKKPAKKPAAVKAAKPTVKKVRIRVKWLMCKFGHWCSCSLHRLFFLPRRLQTTAVKKV